MRRSICRGFVAAILSWFWLAGPAGANSGSGGGSLHDHEGDGIEAAREHLYEHHGGGLHYLFAADRFEFRSDDGDKGFLWDLQGWYGGDLHRLWLKSEGEYESGRDEEPSGVEGAEIQALYGRAVARYFDLQMGIRHDLEPSPSRTYAVLGVQGLAPQWFEVDGALFLSDEGDLSARVEVEYDLLLTQRLVFQPRAEVTAAAQDVPELGLGSGISSLAFGARLRYEIRPEFAPYVGVSWNETFGGTADFARADGGSPRASAFVAGFRFWY